MTVLLQVQILGSLLRFGQSPAFFFTVIGSSANFYTDQWEEYHSNVMTTNVAGIMGVTEV